MRHNENCRCQDCIISKTMRPENQLLFHRMDKLRWIVGAWWKSVVVTFKAAIFGVALLAFAALVFCSGTASAEQKYSDGDEGGNVLWEVSVGQTYRFIERDFTGGTNVAVTMYSQSRDWRLSLGVITGQLLHTNRELAKQLGITRHVHWHQTVKRYSYLTGQYIHTFREDRMLQPFLAFGPSLHDKVFPVEGGYLSWASSLGLGIGDHFGVEFRHNSNAGLWLPNWGQNVASLTWRF